MEIFDSSMSAGVTMADFESAFGEISAVRTPLFSLSDLPPPLLLLL